MSTAKNRVTTKSSNYFVLKATLDACNGHMVDMHEGSAFHIECMHNYAN